MHYKEKLYLAKSFRKNLTNSEKIFWGKIRDKKFLDLKFKRQYIILNYILDFYCPSLKLAIEIDGNIHDNEQQKNKDQLRQQLIEKGEIKFIRFKNDEIQSSIDNVLTKLKKYIQQIASPSPEVERGKEGVRPDALYWHAFNLVNNFGPVRIKRLLDYFGNLENAWPANMGDLHYAGIENSIINNFIIKRNEIDPEQEMKKMPADIKIITIKDSLYPKMLKEIHYAPFILYIKGDEKILSAPAIAVVGSRNMTEYGTRVCQDFTQQLSSLGLAIVSGLAEGIDTIAHQSCLNNNGQTIAVLGSGINGSCIFPAHNKKLVNNIINAQGAIISEYAPNMKAQRQFFPARNRIISGLSLGTIIIEAREKSGALITAYQALEQNREVFAVPGSVYSSRSGGCHKLIQKGAKLAQNVQDIIDELPINLTIKNSVETRYIASLQNLSINEQQILSLFSAESLHIDKIIKSCRLSKSCLLANLTSLELKGIIQKNNNHHYILCQKI